MRTISIIIVFLMIIGCKKEYSPQEIQALNDTISKYDKKIDSLQVANSKLPDSIIQKEQNKVIDDIYFYASENSTKLKISAFIKKSRLKKQNPFHEYFIGNYQFNEFRVDPYYNQNKLYRLNINGHPISYENYNTKLITQIENLNDIVKSKYGNSTNSFPLLETFEMDDEYTYLLYQWIIGKKIIEIRLKPSKTHYYVNLEIYQPEIEKKLIGDEKKAKKEVNLKANKII